MNEFLVLKFKAGNDKKYEVEAIQDNVIDAKKINKHLPRLYYLVA